MPEHRADSDPLERDAEDAEQHAGSDDGDQQRHLPLDQQGEREQQAHRHPLAVGEVHRPVDDEGEVEADRNQREQAADGETAQRCLEHEAPGDRAAGRIGAGLRATVLDSLSELEFAI